MSLYEINKKLIYLQHHVGFDDISICPWTYPNGFCCVWIFTYVLAFDFAVTMSDICLPFTGHSNI